MNLEEILQTVLPSFHKLGRDGSYVPLQMQSNESVNNFDFLGKQELQEILEEEGFAEVVCHFCNEAYRFEEEDLKTDDWI